MSQEIEFEKQKQQPDRPDMVGDILRKERITRRITVDTIAKDLKLNVKYIKALEGNDYKALPADPYVRVYLKSLAKYLSLDSEAILKQFYKERGIIPDIHDKNATEKIKISMQTKEKSGSPFIPIIIILIILIGAFSFIAQKQGWLVTDTPATQPAPSDPEFTDTGSADDSTLADSLLPVTPPDEADSTYQTDESAIDVPVDTTTLMHFQLSVVKDSVWIQVYSDGDSWKNIIYKNQHRSFTARDSFNIHVGNIKCAKFTLNNKPVKVTGKGVVAFKLDRTATPVKWTLSKWNSVFNNNN
jgi:cytoskeletal protein RodZ